MHHLNRDENTNLYADTGYKDVEMNKDKDDDWRLTCREQTLAFCHRGENGLDMGRAGADVLEMRVPVIFSIDADGKVYRI